MRTSLVSSAAFVPLIIFDIALISIYVFLRFSFRGTGIEVLPLWDIGVDQSIGEYTNFAKWGLTILCLSIAALRSKSAALAALVLVYLLLLADDSMQIHETGGHMIVESLGIDAGFGLRPQDYGELVTWMGIGSVVLLLFAVARTRARPAERPIVAMLFKVFLALVFCGVGMDMLHSMLVGVSGKLGLIVGIAEDGGEMVFTSLTAAVAAAALRTTPARADAARAATGDIAKEPSAG